MKRFRFYIIFITLPGFFLLSSCGLFSDPLPEKARIQITSEESESVDLVVSTSFLAQRQAQHEEGIVVGDTTVVLLLSADTLTVDLPFDTEYSIRERHRIFAELQLDGDDRMYLLRGWVDGDEKFNASSEMKSDGKLRFIYYFQRGEDVIIRPQP